VVRSVTTADAEHVDVEAFEVLRCPLKLVPGVYRSDDALIAELTCEAKSGPGVAEVSATLGVEDDADAGHV